MASKKKERDLRERTRAAVTYINANRGDTTELEAFAFMRLFHPEKNEQVARELARNMRKPQSK